MLWSPRVFEERVSRQSWHPILALPSGHARMPIYHCFPFRLSSVNWPLNFYHSRVPLLVSVDDSATFTTPSSPWSSWSGSFILYCQPVDCLFLFVDSTGTTCFQFASISLSSCRDVSQITSISGGTDKIFHWPTFIVQLQQS